MGKVALIRLGEFCDFGVDEADTEVATGEKFAEKNGSSSEFWARASDFSRAVTICQKHLDDQMVEQ